MVLCSGQGKPTELRRVGHRLRYTSLHSSRASRASRKDAKVQRFFSHNLSPPLRLCVRESDFGVLFGFDQLLVARDDSQPIDNPGWFCVGQGKPTELRRVGHRLRYTSLHSSRASRASRASGSRASRKGASAKVLSPHTLCASAPLRERIRFWRAFRLRSIARRERRLTAH